MTHDLTILAAPARAARWGIAAWRWRHRSARAYWDGADLAPLAPLAPLVPDLGKAVGVVRMAMRGGTNQWPEPGTQPRCPCCGGRRCAGCESPPRDAAHDTGHQPEHELAGAPPSLAPALALMDPVTRARELVRQLGQRLWWPWGDVTDQRMRLRLRAHAIAARHGRRTTLGSTRREVALP